MLQYGTVILIGGKEHATILALCLAGDVVAATGWLGTAC